MGDPLETTKAHLAALADEPEEQGLSLETLQFCQTLILDRAVPASAADFEDIARIVANAKREVAAAIGRAVAADTIQGLIDEEKARRADGASAR